MRGLSSIAAMIAVLSSLMLLIAIAMLMLYMLRSYSYALSRTVNLGTSLLGCNMNEGVTIRLGGLNLSLSRSCLIVYLRNSTIVIYPYISPAG